MLDSGEWGNGGIIGGGYIFANTDYDLSHCSKQFS